jgi:hypothetical protein
MWNVTDLSSIISASLFFSFRMPSCGIMCIWFFLDKDVHLMVIILALWVLGVMILFSGHIKIWCRWNR